MEQKVLPAVERGSIFNNISGHTDGKCRRLDRIEGGIGKVSVRCGFRLPSDRNGSSAFAVGMFRDIHKKKTPSSGLPGTAATRCTSRCTTTTTSGSRMSLSSSVRLSSLVCPLFPSAPFRLNQLLALWPRCFMRLKTNKKLFFFKKKRKRRLDKE